MKCTVQRVLGILMVLSVLAECLTEEEAKRENIMKALYRLNDQNSYRLYRASRSNGKPTFIRFGKRSQPASFDPYVQPAWST
ncbi:unnamed protein product [Bursaphelenchus okinawaensis]|uniref:Uncharacterized protein n=1 Tax=Bursaphelenchus okinawaensis TaxID=465554 RepID=A0A811K1B3_9BILA|nr:unnamed protein product [Bursaphelenchus okinawaensis]CAG9089857.1 unnamed protein product [Bursaphelenchus okinawaensis]